MGLHRLFWIIPTGIAAAGGVVRPLPGRGAVRGRSRRGAPARGAVIVGEDLGTVPDARARDAGRARRARHVRRAVRDTGTGRRRPAPPAPQLACSLNTHDTRRRSRPGGDRSTPARRHAARHLAGGRAPRRERRNAAHAAALGASTLDRPRRRGAASCSPPRGPLARDRAAERARHAGERELARRTAPTFGDSTTFDAACPDARLRHSSPRTRAPARPGAPRR